MSNKENIESSEVRWPKANYQKIGIEEYDNNPLITALPPVFDFEKAYSGMMVSPPYQEEQRCLSPELRFHALFRLQHFFQPINKNIELEKKISKLIRSGYVSRNPLDPLYIQQLYGLSSPNSLNTASSFTLMGFSGMGKTTAIERILALYPQCIIHPNPVNLVQIVWLKLDCPHNGSLKTLCMNFFDKIDQLIRTNYHKKYGNPRYSVSAMIDKMEQVARIHCIGVLIIDEIQHLLTAKDNGSEEMMNFFVTLINKIGVPIMLIGTMRARSVLQQDFRQARRGSGLGDMVWENMQKGQDWEWLINQMWRYQWTAHQVPLTKELYDAIYEESQGIIDIAVKLYVLAQSRAIETGKETITVASIRKVAKEDLRLVQPMLQALRSGLESELDKYEDIKPLKIKDYLNNRVDYINIRDKMLELKLQKEEEKRKQDTSVIEQAIHSLIALGIDAEKAESVVKQVIRNSKNVTSIQVVSKALVLLEEKKKKLNPKARLSQQNLLASIIKEGNKVGKSVYESLESNGSIKNPLAEFLI
ncbi:AAA family ATPase [Bacillus cereus]|uniref:AAA family ATPase n=1 Tax=Bacillus cereus TaxID=1396 RepID=UPI001443C51A|nr:AAA family ATPase [Bacillus cereus]